MLSLEIAMLYSVEKRALTSAPAHGVVSVLPLRAAADDEPPALMGCFRFLP
jgi:hypothetical protein